MMDDFVGRVYFGDNLPLLNGLPDESVQLIYIDPPFNTGRAQVRTQIQTERSAEGDRVGFKGQRYRSVVLGQQKFEDTFSDYLGFLAPRLEQSYRLLAPNGSLYFHIDYREVHYCKLLLDEIFGRECFINEIIWAYDYGGRPRTRWPAKHDNILFYVKDPKNYTLILMRSIGSPIWRPAWWEKKKQKKANSRRIPGGIPSSAQPGKKKPGTQPKNPLESFAESCRHLQMLGIWSWISLPGAGQPGLPPLNLTAVSS